ncbi:hypothetical protein DFJ74DRAFT_662736 [Hyaloraphidium curvatum]|nr:hypothetical protein DFJ74DRAFT_662736 [Hyaloraphidium curvatum]
MDGSADAPKPRRKPGRKPLPLGDEERKQRRLEQNRRAQLGFRARQEAALRNAAAAAENARRLEAHSAELRRRAEELQGALLAVLRGSAGRSDADLQALWALAAAPLPGHPELVPIDRDADRNDRSSLRLPVSPPRSSDESAEFAEAAALLSLSSPLAPYQQAVHAPPITPPTASPPMEPTSVFFESADPALALDLDSDLFAASFPLAAELFPALRDTLLSLPSSSNPPDFDGLLRDLGLPPLEEERGEEADACCDPSCPSNPAGWDEQRLRRCFDSLPHITMRSLLHALESAGFGGTYALCAELKTNARCGGDPADIGKWTLPREAFDRWPVLRAIPLGER